MMLFIEKGIMELFLDMFEFSDSNNIIQILKGVDSILEFLSSQSEIRLIYEKRLKDSLEELQVHPDVNVYEASKKIIEKYFSYE